MTVFGLSSLFIASATAVERALASRAPHWCASHMKTRATRSVLFGVWLAVLAFALLPVLGVGQYSIQWPGTWCFISTGGGGNGTSSSRNWGNRFFSSTFAFLGLSALTITFACNLATIKALVSRCRAKVTASQSSAQWGRITTETAIQLLGIMCVLSVCWSPLLVGSSRGCIGLGGVPAGIAHFSKGQYQQGYVCNRRTMGRTFARAVLVAASELSSFLAERLPRARHRVRFWLCIHGDHRAAHILIRESKRMPMYEVHLQGYGFLLGAIGNRVLMTPVAWCCGFSLYFKYLSHVEAIFSLQKYSPCDCRQAQPCCSF